MLLNEGVLCMSEEGVSACYEDMQERLEIVKIVVIGKTSRAAVPPSNGFQEEAGFFLTNGKRKNKDYPTLCT